MGKKYKYINLYDCEKFYDTGRGCIQYRIEFDDDEEFLSKKKIAREKQAVVNARWRADNNKQKKINIKKAINTDGTKLTARQDALVNGLRGRSDKSNYGLNKRLNVFDNTLCKLPCIKLDKQTGNSIVLLGSSKAGKTTLLNHIYKDYFSSKDAPCFKSGFSKDPISVLFSVNVHAKIYQDPAIKGVIKVNKFNKDANEMIKKMKRINCEQRNKFNYLVILDDIIDAKYSGTLNNLILTYRNSNFSSIISLQYPYLLSKSSRSSINQCFFGSFNTDESIVSVLKSFLGSAFSRLGYHTQDAQVDLYRELTKDYHFLYYYSRDRVLVRFKLTI